MLISVLEEGEGQIPLSRPFSMYMWFCHSYELLLFVLLRYSFTVPEQGRHGLQLLLSGKQKTPIDQKKALAIKKNKKQKNNRNSCYYICRKNTRANVAKCGIALSSIMAFSVASGNQTDIRHKKFIFLYHG